MHEIYALPVAVFQTDEDVSVIVSSPRLRTAIKSTFRVFFKFNDTRNIRLFANHFKRVNL